jgi:hypothetical protein
MKPTSVLLMSLLVSQPLWALAQPQTAPAASQPVLLPLPPGKPVQSGSELLRGYSLEEFKIVLRIHADYRAWGIQVPVLKEEVKHYEGLVENLYKQLKLQEENTTLLKEDRARLYEKWQTDNRLRHECENKPAFGSWVAWTAAAVMTAVSITFVALWLEARN